MNTQMSKMNKLMRESILEVVKMCAEKYEFSYESAKEFLEGKEERGFKYPIPYSGKVHEGLCCGVAVNHGLYTQCQKVVVLDTDLCVSCKKQSDTNLSGEPDNGLIMNRDVEDWKSPSGKSASSYLSVLRKMKVEVSLVKEEASKYKIIIDEKHFQEERKTKERGRPKNPEKEVEVNATENLFQELVQSQMGVVAVSSVVVAASVAASVEMSPAKEKKSEKKENKLMGAEEKEQKEVAKELAKEQALKDKELAKEQALKDKELAKEQALKEKELAKEQAIKDKELAKEQAIKDKELAKEQEKLAKEQAIKDKEQEKKNKELAKEQAIKDKEQAIKDKEQEKKNKELAKEQEKLAKEQEKLAKEQAKKDKPAKKTKKSSGSDSDSESSVKSTAKSVSTVASAAPVEDAPIKVRKLQHKGTTYLHDAKSGAIYDIESNDHIGQWNEVKKDIDFLEEEVELEEEEEDSDDEEKVHPSDAEADADEDA
jgi:hypothetical protein